MRLIESSHLMGYRIPSRSLSPDVVRALREDGFQVEDEVLTRGCTHFAGYRGAQFDSWLCRTRFPVDVRHPTSLNLVIIGESKESAGDSRFAVYEDDSPLPRRDPSKGPEAGTWLPVRQGFLLFRPPLGLQSPPTARYRVRYPVDPGYPQQFDLSESDREPVDFVLRGVEIDGDLRSALLAPAPAEYAFPVVVPEVARLQIGIGVLEEGWFESDGVEFTLGVRSSEGERRELFRKVLDPRGNEVHRRWQDVDLDLSPFAGTRVELWLATSPGPEGDPQYDLGAFSNPTIYSAENQLTPVIVVDIDTLRADHLESYGYDRPTSPVIQRLARDGVVFEQAIAQAPWTLPSQMSILTGLYPASHGVRAPEQRLAPEIPSLASILRDHGYFTKAITDGAFLSHEFGFDRGFDSYWEHQGQRAQSHALVADLIRRFRQWFDLWVPRNLFLLLHTFETHAPYAPRREDIRRFDPSYTSDVGDRFNRAFFASKAPSFRASPRELEHLIARYDGEIRYVDETLGRIFAMLEARGFYDESLIVLLSDHGEEFFDHGDWMHGKTFFDEVIRVPLIIKFPRGTLSPRRIRQQVETIDVLPTVLDFLGLPIPEHLDGTSLMPLLGPEPERWEAAHPHAISEELGAFGAAARTRTHKLIRGKRQTLRFSLQDDPAELHPLEKLEPSVSAELELALDAYLAGAAAASTREREGEGELGEGLETRLRALGYIE